MPAILFVRVTSNLEPAEFARRLLERRPRFQAVPGLTQKVYGRDPATGEVCGIYFFESAEALAAFRTSELARTIPSAYEAVDVRREVYDVLYSLWPDRGPLPAVERAVTYVQEAFEPALQRAAAGDERPVRSEVRTRAPEGPEL